MPWSEQGVLAADHIHLGAVVDHHVLAQQQHGHGIAHLYRGRLGHANVGRRWRFRRSEADAATADHAIGCIEEHRTGGSLQIRQPHRQGLPFFGKHAGCINKAQITGLAQHLFPLSQVAGKSGWHPDVIRDQGVEALVFLRKSAGQIHQNQLWSGGGVVPEGLGQDHPDRTGE